MGAVETNIVQLTADLPGTGGERREPEDFIVEEIPAYLPSGQGTHTYAFIEKRGLTTVQAIDQLCRVLPIDKAQVGYAGMKDRQAITRQWLSLGDVSEAVFGSFAHDAISILQVGRHGNKLRTGHLRGNRFVVRLHDVHDEGLARAQAILQQLVTVGVPNYYGEQRFGMHGDNAAQGLRVLRGEARPPKDRMKRRLFASSLQSQLFNEFLNERVRTSQLKHMLGGEVLQRTDSGGVFISDDREADQPRLERDELVITGPMCGPKMMRPKEGGAAREAEDALFARHELSPEDFSAFDRLARGTRRPLTVPLVNAEVSCPEARQLLLQFSLPAGAYATVVLSEITKN